MDREVIHFYTEPT